MKNNILIIIIVTLVAIGVIAAVIFAGIAKGFESSSVSDDIPDWGGNSFDSEYSESSQTSSSISFSSSGSSVSLPVSTESATSDNPIVSSSTTTSRTPNSGSEFSAAESIVATANSLIGVPFVLGGNSPDGFDNPGFIYYVLRENGFHNCTHSTAKQSKMGRQLTFSELKAGDLVFFTDEERAEAKFGGIYIGDGKMVASLTPSKGEPGVMIADITTPYYQRNFFCGVSLS